MISVVIPAYNAGPCVGRAIDSILAQSFTDYEIIVVDDGSTDDTAEAVKKYGDKVRYIYQENAGSSVARNGGIEAAKGDWIAFLDADDEWLPEKLRLQVELLGRNPQLRWCACNRYQADGGRRSVLGDTKAIEKALAGSDYFENYFTAAAKSLCPIITSTIIVRKDVFSELDGFDRQFLRGQDIDMWWRIGHYYPEIGYIAEPLAVLHLDLANDVLTQRRLEAKRGLVIRELVSRHLKLAQQENSMEQFKAFAIFHLRNALLQAVFRGFKKDAREMVTQFTDYFPWYWRIGTYFLTIFPELSSFVLRKLLYIGHVLGFERQVTRRWGYSKESEKE